MESMQRQFDQGALLFLLTVPTPTCVHILILAAVHCEEEAMLVCTSASIYNKPGSP